MPGQLDEISEAIGEIRGTLAGVEKYIHQREHGIANLSGKVDGLAVQFSKEIAAAKAEINVSVQTAIEKVEARLQIIDERVTVLEKAGERETGAKNLAVTVLQSPLVGWLFAAAVMLAAWWKGIHPK